MSKSREKWQPSHVHSPTTQCHSQCVVHNVPANVRTERNHFFIKFLSIFSCSFVWSDNGAVKNERIDTHDLDIHHVFHSSAVIQFLIASCVIHHQNCHFHLRFILQRSKKEASKQICIEIHGTMGFPNSIDTATACDSDNCNWKRQNEWNIC